MAKTLTPEQREAKRQRDAAYRARKAAQKNQTPIDIEVDVDEFLAEAEELDAWANQVLDDLDIVETPAPDPAFAKFAVDHANALGAQLGDMVTAPVTQLEAMVAKTFRGGGRLLTEDGEHMWANQCPHSTEERETRGTVIFYEMVGEGNKDFADGATGNVHRFSRCNKVIL